MEFNSLNTSPVRAISLFGEGAVMSRNSNSAMNLQNSAPKTPKAHRQTEDTQSAEQDKVVSKYDRQMELARKIMKRDDALLRALAK
jgi:hypothetical protein